MYYLGYQAVWLLVFVVLGGALINQIKNIPSIYKFLIYIILLNLLLTILSPKISLFSLLAYESIGTNNPIDFWSIRGQIGDLLAGHFAALAFIGLLINITQMKTSLEKQDKAIKIQKKKWNNKERKWKKTADSLELQSKLYEKQNFENTFFNY